MGFYSVVKKNELRKLQENEWNCKGLLYWVK